MTAVHKLADLRAGDVMIFLSVARCASVNGAARELNVPASQVSKAVARLEEQLGVPLMVRSTKGVRISNDGNRLMPDLTDLVKRIEALQRRDELATAISVAAPSYMINWCAPTIAQSLPDVRLRAIEMAPALMRTLAASNFFDVGLTFALERFPDSWVSTHVGEVRRTAFATPALLAELGPQPLSIETVRAARWVLPVYNSNGVYVPVDDGCPLAASERNAGHEAQTIGLALEIAIATNQLVFGPYMAAHRYLLDGRLVEVEIEGWNERNQVYVACNVDRVRASQQRQIADAVSQALGRLRQPAA